MKNLAWLLALPAAGVCLLLSPGGSWAMQAPAPPAPASSAASSAPSPPPASPPGARHRVYLEAGLLPILDVQMIEGPSRDDTVVSELGLSTALSAAYAALPWLEGGLHFQLDAGSAKRSLYTRPDAAGETAAAQQVDGAFWEMWLALLLRFRVGPVFAEAGWAPLILRSDTTRTDLPNASGETDGIFVGSRSVAYLLGLGGQVALTPSLDLTLRVQYRIRYLVSRGGEPLAGDEEFGNMRLSPMIGLGYHF